MNSNRGVVATFADKFGETRVIHATRTGLHIQRRHSTVVLTLTPIVGRCLGANIRALREARGLTLAQLCRKSGLVAVVPKSRMWEIENNTRKQAIRLGTLYEIGRAH